MLVNYYKFSLFYSVLFVLAVIYSQSNCVRCHHKKYSTVVGKGWGLEVPRDSTGSWETSLVPKVMKGLWRNTGSPPPTQSGNLLNVLWITFTALHVQTPVHVRELL